MSSCNFVGNVVKVPELGKAGNNSVVNFSLAVNRRYKQGEEWKEETSFFDFVVWGNTAENFVKYVKKGDRITILGAEAIQRRFEDKKNGGTRSVVEFRVDSKNIFFPPKGKGVKSDENAETDAGAEVEAELEEAAPF